MAKREFKEKYELDEDQIQDLLNLSKEGDEAAKNRLLEVFSNFLIKYKHLLWDGKYGLQDYDLRRFIGLFIKDPRVRFALMKNRLTVSQRKELNEAISGITYMTRRYGDEIDIEQTVNAAFFQCVFIYKKRGAVPFSGYLYAYYFYVLKKMVDNFLIDQLGRKTFPLIQQEDLNDDSSGNEKLPGFIAPVSPSAEDLYGNLEIDEYWVAGDSAMFPFNTLTIQDRQLLKWRFVDRERASEIALRITEHPNTVREHFQRIKTKLRLVLEDQIEHEKEMGFS